jgi:hypothetical protein
MGHVNWAASSEVKGEAYARLSAAAAAGEIDVQVDALPLAEVREAWRRLAAGSHRKLVLNP